MEFVTFNAEYLEKLRAGDLPTQRHFVGYFSELIQLKVRSKVATKESLEDVRQETFARVLGMLRKEGGLRQAERLGSFVNSVCNHVLMEHYRGQRKNGSPLEEESDEVFVDAGPSPLNELETKDRARVVQASLAELGDRDRDLLRKVLMEERDKDEVCAEMGVTREYLRVLVHRAKQSFRSVYEVKDGEVKDGGQGDVRPGGRRKI